MDRVLNRETLKGALDHLGSPPRYVGL